MDIEQIRKEMTREEFINKIKTEEYWGEGVNYESSFWYDKYTKINCPNDIGLESCIGIDKRDCYNCWLNSIKDDRIKFKNEY